MRLHGCRQLLQSVHEPDVPIEYVVPWRQYRMIGPTGFSHMLRYCPFDGERLPKELSSAWVTEVVKAGFEADLDNPELPDRFWTAEWWSTEHYLPNPGQR